MKKPTRFGLLLFIPGLFFVFIAVVLAEPSDLGELTDATIGQVEHNLLAASTPTEQGELRTGLAPTASFTITHSVPIYANVPAYFTAMLVQGGLEAS